MHQAVGFGGEGVMPSPVGWIGTESGEPGGAGTSFSFVPSITYSYI
jgi:hypothetical protein